MLIDKKRRPKYAHECFSIHASFSPCLIGLGYSVVRIRQQWERESVFLLECQMFLHTVGRYAYDRNVCDFESSVLVTELACFGSSSRGEIFGIKIDHQLLPLIASECHFFPVLVLESELWSAHTLAN